MRLRQAARVASDPALVAYAGALARKGDVAGLAALARGMARGPQRSTPPALAVDLARMEPVPKRAESGLRAVLPFPARLFAAPPPTRIGLAGVEVEPGSWSRAFADPEDAMSLHRLGWALRWEAQGAQPWGLVSDWLDAAERELPAEAHDVYTMAERCANLVTLASLSSPPAPLAPRVASRVARDSAAVAARLEWYGRARTNNHILNDARALVLAGAALEDEARTSLGARLLLDEISHHVASDGVLREGSTHYQRVVARWMTEAALALRATHQAGAGDVARWAQVMLDASERLAWAGGPARIGDVSPDVPPAWLEGATAAARRALDGDVPAAREPGDSWAALWSELAPEPRQARLSWVSEDGAWGRLAAHGWDVLAHATPPADTRASHAHEDSFSFVLARHDEPFVVDRGRFDYRSDPASSDAALLARHHNGVLVDGKGIDLRARGAMDGPRLAALRAKRLTFFADANSLTLLAEAPPRMRGVDRIVREWRIEQDELSVLTRIEGHGERVVELPLHTEADSSPTRDGATLSGRTTRLRTRCTMGKPSVTLCDVFPRYGARAAGQRLSWRACVRLPFEARITFTEEAG